MALTDEQLEYISDALIPLFQYLEEQVIIDVANRIKESMAYTRTAELEAVNMRKLGYSPARIRKEAMKLLKSDPEYRKLVAKNTLEHKKKVKKLLQSIMKSAHAAKDKILSRAADLSFLDDLRVWKQGGKELTDRSFLPQLVDAARQQTSETLKNMTKTTGFKTMSGFEAVENLYQRELDKAMIKICSGTFSREQVVYDVVHSLAESGLRTIDFSSGYSMQLDTAVKLAIRTGAHQLSGKIMDADILQTGVNLVYVSRHWGARNTDTGHANHEQWQGKVYFIKDGTDYSEEAKRIGQDRIMSLWYATGYSVDGSKANDPLGLYGFNCRHKHHPWFIGVSELTPEDPEPEAVTINGRTYDYYAIEQKKRSMERRIRAMKREREAMKALNMDTKQISKSIKQKIYDYENFCDTAKVKSDINRLRYESGTSDLKKTEAWKKYHDSIFESELKAKTLGASDKAGDGSEPVHIGQIDMDRKQEAIEYFGEQIRNSEIEKLYVIDKDGNVYYNEGDEDTVSIGTLDLTGCAVLHNHPKVNGILSFGSDDFKEIRDQGVSEWYLFNERYDYYAKKIKSMDKLTYNPYYLEAMKNAGRTDDLQHFVFIRLKEDGYIEYERKAINRRAKRQNQ